MTVAPVPARYPAEPFTLIVPFPVDGVTDFTARVLARHLEQRWGRAVTIVNVAGQGGATGTLQLLAAPADGRTMMLCATGQATQNPAIDSASPYRWDEPTPVARVTASALAFVVRGASRWTSLAELFAHVRAAPAQHHIGTSGTGVGSVGTYCGVALLMSGAGDPLFLQFKEARMSVLEDYCGRVPMQHHGERVVFGQRLLQSSADIFLGWMTSPATGRHFYVRQLRDAKIKPMVELMRPSELLGYACACGWALARGRTSAQAMRLP